jgi:carboxy-terminal domain RNA polymerase II polypeptide A small phosphatase
LDQNNVAPQRLFREHCSFHNGVFVKDMSKVGRPMKDLIIIDNSPTSYMFQPENGMPILSWYDERADNKLIELIPVLKALSEVPDVRTVLSQSVTKDNVYINEKSLKICE